MNLARALTTLGHKVERKHPDINWGGCGVFAALVAKRLKKHFDVKIRVGNDITPEVAIDDIRTRVESNTVDEWNCEDMWFSHVVIEFQWKGKTYHYDTTGLHEASDTTYMGGYPIVEGHLTVREMTELARSKGWNTSFDRDSIPEIRKTINAAFKRINKRLKVAKTT